MLAIDTWEFSLDTAFLRMNLGVEMARNPSMRSLGRENSEVGSTYAHNASDACEHAFLFTSHAHGGALPSGSGDLPSPRDAPESGRGEFTGRDGQRSARDLPQHNVASHEDVIPAPPFDRLSATPHLTSEQPTAAP